MGVFLRSAVNAKAKSEKEKLLIQWTATNADDKVIKDLTKDDHKGTNSSSDVEQNWKNMKKFFGGI